MTVPTTLHHIWLGPRPVPQEWADAWKAMHPGWEQRIWREADLERLPMIAGDLYRRLLADGVWHGAADVARLEILYAQGGVYVDIDSKPLRPLTFAPFMSADVFAGYEPVASLPGRVANGTIGAVAGSEVIRTALELVMGMRVVDPPWETIGAPALTAAMLVHRKCCDARVLPAHTFYRTDAKGRPVHGTSGPSYSEHFWATTTAKYPVKTVVLVPRRAGIPERDAIWKWCRRIWEQQGWPIFEGHDEGDGLFNASRARNRAAAEAGDEWEVAIFADADTVPWDWKAVRQAVTEAARTDRFIRPFTSYYVLDEQASAAFMATGRKPGHGARRLGNHVYGGIHVVSRRLWDLSGGYDERFVGWGGEDAAYQYACETLSGYSRLPGEVYHLYHPMQRRDPSKPEFIANVALEKRYVDAARDKRAMQALIAERTGPLPFRAGLLLITNGRQECLERTITSIEQHVSPAFAERLICDDSGSPAYAEWLAATYPGYRLDAHPHLGHGPAVARALAAAARMDVEWVFVCEDDMEFQVPVDLVKLAGEMDANPQLTQMILRRQAWFPDEVAAGGMIERFDPAVFTEHVQNGTTYLEHRQFWSISSNLVRRSFLAAHPWPKVPNSEHRFSRSLFRDPGVSAGIWGAKADPPMVLHIGAERTGDGY